jgi:L,D-peptidoglycan transpeptidase YkuD (ErfK/YbiS/YcfS/YnhG family)
VSGPVVTADGWLSWGVRRWRCAFGPAGIRADKREGDGATPAGRFPLRRLLWRADRLARPATALPTAPIDSADGWCDDPTHADYNRQVRLPHPARAERLWREDGLYDLVVVLGHNDDPPVAGHGSAIFLHVARPDYAPTLGCVALARADLLDMLRDCRPGLMLVLGDAASGAR